MQPYRIIFSIILALIVVLPAQGQGSGITATIRATRKATSKDAQNKWDNKIGGSGYNQEQSIIIETELRNTSTTSAVFQIAVYFVAKDLKTNERNIFDYKDGSRFLEAGEAVKAEWGSKEISSRIGHYRSGTSRSGLSPDGYLVTVSSSGARICSAASNSQLETLSRDPKRLAAMFHAAVSNTLIQISSP